MNRPLSGARTLRCAGAAAVLLTLYALSPTPRGWRASVVTLAMFGAALVLLALYLRVLLRWRRGTRSVDPGAVAESLVLVVLGAVLAFSLIYLRLAQVPGQFEGLRTHTDALYFTVTTLTTVGYGDIHPVGQVARALVTAQLVANVVLLGAVVRIASGLLAAGRRRAAEQEDA